MIDDSINRQAAIRWVKTECNPYGKPTLEFESGKRVIEHLENMPPAQPEIIRCKDCKHRDPEDKKCDSGHAIQWQLPRDDDWFCADAERREMTT